MNTEANNRKFSTFWGKRNKNRQKSEKWGILKRWKIWRNEKFWRNEKIVWSEWKTSGQKRKLKFKKNRIFGKGVANAFVGLG